MNGLGRKDHWEHLYGAKKEDEVSWFQEDPGVSLALINQATVPRTASIIDVGGGASRLVDHLLAAGHTNVTVLDIAEAALAQTRQRLGPRGSLVNWVVADITRWKPVATYDVWHDRAVFHFLTEPEDRAAYRKALRSALAPGGTIIIGTFAPEGPERCSGLPVVRYAPPDLAAELGEGFQLLDTVEDGHRTPAGAIQRFQFCRFKVKPVSL